MAARRPKRAEQESLDGRFSKTTVFHPQVAISGGVSRSGKPPGSYDPPGC